MARRVSVEVGFCCGASCARVFVNGEQVVHEKDYGEDYRRWDDAPMNDPDLEYLEWKTHVAALKKALAEAVRRKKITQEEADRLLKKWLSDNPNPNGEEEEELGEDVTEDFRKMQESLAKRKVRVEEENETQR